LLTTKGFLAVNGQRLHARTDAAEGFMLRLVATNSELDVIADWLEQHCADAEAPDLPDPDSP